MTGSNASATTERQDSTIVPDTKSTKLTGEDMVVIGFSLLGLLGSVALYALRMPSIMTAIFLSAGITALVYRFLGGIEGASFAIGALKLGGTIAALIGVAYWINSTKELDPQHRFYLPSEDQMVGEWQWDVVGPGASWDGYLKFVKVNGKLTFSGREYNWQKTAEGDKRTPFLEMTNGMATVMDGDKLTLESDVMDYQYGRKFHWRSVEPLGIRPAFLGRLRPQKADDPNLEANPWGIMIYKKADNQ